jgi:DNA-binding XRE family transcriptional regulator
MNTIEYLKAAKAALGIESDYALAKAIGTTRSNMSSLANGKSTMSDETALKVAEILKKHPAIVLADMHAEREKNPAVRAVWLNVMEKFSLGFDVLTLCCTPRGIRLSA